MAFSLISRSLLRTSRELLERNMAVGAVSMLNGFVDIEMHPSHPTRTISTSTPALIRQTPQYLQTPVPPNSTVNPASHVYKKKSKHPKRQQDEESGSDTDSDDEFERKRQNMHKKYSQKGDSEFWRRKMRTLHRILDINRDGVISFDDFKLLHKRFTDLGHLNEELSAEFLHVMEETWKEQFGEITPYNLINADQFLTDLHHRLNDKKMFKTMGKFLPYLFKAVDYDHSGHLDLDQYKLFFRCLGLSNEDAAISFAVIDKNGDGQLSLKEFVHLGRQFFITEDESKISKMFWGPLIDH
ncbi:sarcoplasmic calcium-binding protein [Stomoxys calcitrans]|uniref:EF-hand domain-containing protein n=1 Tax=Stomoxys calcitrans TaxID=35570 RepID=A0A1I8PL50_STOCA|nr:sarcoplasmic calcium-binding protein [Stomoxys calcitrans]